jgi:membrane protease subunit (stomatin/prohibitin family)
LKNDTVFSRFDHVVTSKPDNMTGEVRSVFLVEGGLRDPAHRREGVTIAQGMNTPMTESTVVMNDALKTQQQEQQQALQQQRQQQQTQEQSSGPMMRMPGGPSRFPGGDGGQ